MELIENAIYWIVVRLYSASIAYVTVYICA